jgi:hypothetical protein
MYNQENTGVQVEALTGAEAQPDMAKADTSSIRREPGLLTRITEHPSIRNAVFALSAIIGGAGIVGQSGCAPENGSYNNQVSAVRMLEREAKFSTLGTESKVTFEQMPKLLESREAMLKAVDSTIPHAREVVTHFEADHVVSKESLESLKIQLTTLQEIVTASSGSESFEAVKVRLTELKQKIDEVAVLTVADFGQGAQSVGYLKIQPLMQALYDWNTALERDVVNFKAGVHALSVAQLADVVAKTEAALKPIQNEESITKWVSLHNEDARKVGEAITTAIAKVSESATDQAFASVRDGCEKRAVRF